MWNKLLVNVQNTGSKEQFKREVKDIINNFEQINICDQPRGKGMGVQYSRTKSL